MSLSRRAVLATPLFLPAVIARAAASVLVAAAADLAYALPDLIALFEKEHGTSIQVVFGSSGALAHQIENGAPFELFLSADESYPIALHAKGLTPDAGVFYAEGRLVFFATPRAPYATDADLARLTAALARNAVGHVALANPDHAPYGRAARSLLENLGLWEKLAPHLVYGESVQQAAAFVQSGAAEAGFLPLALSLPPAPLAALGHFTVIPPARHAQAPLRQRMVLTEKASAGAKAFFNFLQTPAAGGILTRYGFSLPTHGQ